MYLSLNNSHRLIIIPSSSATLAMLSKLTTTTKDPGLTTMMMLPVTTKLATTSESLMVRWLISITYLVAHDLDEISQLEVQVPDGKFRTTLHLRGLTWSWDLPYSLPRFLLALLSSAVALTTIPFLILSLQPFQYFSSFLLSLLYHVQALSTGQNPCSSNSL